MITTTPTKKKIDSKKLDELISKGGAPSKKGTEKVSPTPKIKPVQMRLTQEMVDSIDRKRAGKFGGKTQSRHSFIVQAIEKALEE